MHARVARSVSAHLRQMSRHEPVLLLVCTHCGRVGMLSLEDNAIYLCRCGNPLLAPEQLAALVASQGGSQVAANVTRPVEAPVQGVPSQEKEQLPVVSYTSEKDTAGSVKMCCICA